jgi:UDP-sulfoquinovose synthase
MAGAEIRYYRDPRKEDLENALRVRNEQFLQLGLNPITLDEGLMNEVLDISRKYKHRCDPSRIIATSLWTRDKQVDFDGSDAPVEE